MAMCMSRRGYIYKATNSNGVNTIDSFTYVFTGAYRTARDTSPCVRVWNQLRS